MQNIQQILKEIEARNKVKILYACETGSRAWGIPSPDSDYDIRFIYQHSRDWYLALNTQKDTIEVMDGDLDITGWDLRKCLKLLKKSNVPLIERFQSPIEYYPEEGFKEGFKNLIQHYYSPIASFYHHYSLALKFWEELKEKEEVKLKSYFYLFRSLLSCNWIIRNDAVLPMHIEGLMVHINGAKREEIRELINLKATVNESYLHKHTAGMRKSILELLEQTDSAKDALKTNNQSFALLNKFFINALHEDDTH